MGWLLIMFGRYAKDIPGAGVTGALGGAKKPHDIFINLDGANEIVV